MLIIDPPRPVPRQAMFQRFRFADALERGTLCVFDEGIDPYGGVLAKRKAPALLSGIGKVLSALLPLPSVPHAADPGMREPLSEFVLGMTVGDTRKAYPLDVLVATGNEKLKDTVGNEQVTIVFLPDSAFAYAENAPGHRLPAVVTYRATWLAFYPDSQVYAAKVNPLGFAVEKTTSAVMEEGQSHP